MPKTDNYSTDVTTEDSKNTGQAIDEESESFESETKGKKVSSEKFSKRQSEREKEVIIQEKVIYREKRNGCLGCGCRSLGCFGCLGLLLLCAGVIFIIINRPPFIWNVVVDTLNSGAKYPEIAQISGEKAESDILQQVKSVGQNDVYITEDMLTSIARERIQAFKDVAFDIESNRILMYWKFDASERPVFGVVEFTLDSNSNIKVTKVGTPALSLPDFVNNTVNSFLNSTLDSANGNLVSNLISKNENFKINEIKFLEDKIYVNAFVNLSLF